MYNGDLGAESTAGSRGRARGQGNPVKLKEIHFFDALRRAKFVLLSGISW